MAQPILWCNKRFRLIKEVLTRIIPVCMHIDLKWYSTKLINATPFSGLWCTHALHRPSVTHVAFGCLSSINLYWETLNSSFYLAWWQWWDNHAQWTLTQVWSLGACYHYSSWSTKNDKLTWIRCNLTCRKATGLLLTGLRNSGSIQRTRPSRLTTGNPGTVFATTEVFLWENTGHIWSEVQVWK